MRPRFKAQVRHYQQTEIGSNISSANVSQQISSKTLRVNKIEGKQNRVYHLCFALNANSILEIESQLLQQQISGSNTS